MRIFQKDTRILDNFNISGNYYKIILQAKEIAKLAQPGQFVMVRVNTTCQPLLRRPFSIHRLIGEDGLEILYEVVGYGTEILSQKKPDEYLDIIGPLGTGFVYRLPFTVYRLAILVAGGIGVAPLLFLAEKLANLKNEKAKPEVLVLVGAKTKDEILLEEEFRNLGCKVKVSTDDGSKGFKGSASELFERCLPNTKNQRPVLYGCGPRPMIKELSKMAQYHKIPCQISLDENMACGLGVCLGCVVKTKNGYRRVCKDGPVFNAEEMVWEG